MGNVVEFGNDIAFHPGSYIEEMVNDGPLSLEGFAAQANIPVEDLELLIAGKKDITDEIAEKLHILTCTSTRLWLNLQRQYDTLIADFKAKGWVEE